MPRVIPEGRLAELVECATRVFIDRGYKRTQMADVAAALGVAKGTLYLYVESKEALFDLAIRHADAPADVGVPRELPLPTPAAGATVDYVQRRLAEQGGLTTLDRALAESGGENVAAELEAIIRELYTRLAANRNGIKLLDRSAVDQPELAALWFEGSREGLMALIVAYLERRTAAGVLEPVPDIPAAARLLIETTVFWAVHRYWDPHPQAVSDETALDTVVRFVVGALAKKEE